MAARGRRPQREPAWSLERRQAQRRRAAPLGLGPESPCGV